MCWEKLDKYREHGLLLLRLGIGGMFIWHGYGKLMGGPELWTKLGGAMGMIGIHFAPKLFGLMATLAEFGGGICLVLGLAVRPAACFLLFTMIIAATMHLMKGDGLQVASHAIEAGIVFCSLIFMGAGKYSLDEKRKKTS